ncbi:MAG TPA: glycosyltransferase family 4 protein [Solirubrobacteraceae bacterium]|jgi:glycosyltransferase involved in cell wall biosynthesis|nr:glycosyltransferase family 4 protein [Solirubrobacteraceae bacterium]
MVLFLHNRYRTTGGEERVVEDLVALVRDRLGEHVELLMRDSAGLGAPRAAAGLLRGGLDEREVADAVRRSGARIVHAHNLLPTLGWRALAAAKEAGARVVLHLHQYRLVCAVGVCFTEGADCTRCHGRDTTPGIRHNCRGDRAEALTYAASLSLWQRRLCSLADAVVVPSRFAEQRLRELGAPLPAGTVSVLPPPVALAGSEDGSEQSPVPGDGHALVVARLAPEKGIDVAIEACRLARVPLVVAGDGPELGRLRALAAGADVRFEGRVGRERLAELRAGASIGLVPSRSAETFGIAAAEAMAAGLPVAASRVGALPELVDENSLITAGDARALAGAIERLAGDEQAGQQGRRRVAELCAPGNVAARLASIYQQAFSRAE